MTSASRTGVRAAMAARRAAVTVLATVVAGGFSLATAPAAHAATSAPGLSASATCIFPNKDGSYTAMFGYSNTSGVTYTIPVSSATDPYNIAGYGVVIPTATVVTSQPTVFPAHSSGLSALRIVVPAGNSAGWALGDLNGTVVMNSSSRVCTSTDVDVTNWKGQLAVGGLLVPLGAVLLSRARTSRRRQLPDHPHAI